jgi:hypothetical protein
MYKKGDYIKCGRKFGVVTHVYDGRCEYTTHNGIKPVHNIADCSQLTLITEERFLAWVERNGYNSMYKYCQQGG